MQPGRRGILRERAPQRQCGKLGRTRLTYVSNGTKSRSHHDIGSELPPELANDTRWRLVLRICQSRAFSKAARPRELLCYVTSSVLTGRTGEVSEFEIGRRVFGRGGDYVPSEDGVVRGAARQLRLKLKEYFETEGRFETLLVDIPKGGYLPVFSERTRETAPAPPAAPETVAPAPRSWRRTAWIGITALNLLVLATTLAVWRVRSAPAAVTRRPSTLVGMVLANAHRPVMVVVSDFSIPLLRGLFHPPAYSLDDYATWDYRLLEPASAGPPEVAELARVLRTHRITRLGDLNIVAGIEHEAAGVANLVVRHARDVSARNFTEGDAIMMGNEYSTPWVALFEEHLNFPHVRSPGVGFLNRRPHAGEQSEYFTASASNERGPGYGRLALVPNLGGKGHVLLIGGVNMVTMEAAGEYALNPQSVPDLLNALHAKSLAQLPYFEAILESGAVDNTPKRARIVAARLIEP